MVKLFPALRDRENPCNFYPSQTRSAMDGALNVSRTAGEFYEVKLTGRNCMDANSTRFPGFRHSPPLPGFDKLTHHGNPLARALPIGARKYRFSLLTSVL